MTFSDPQLVDEIRAGSGVAFDRLMDRYSRLVYHVAYGYTRDRDAALDVSQDTFVQVHERLGSWRGQGPLRNWITRIAANVAMNRRRGEDRRPTAPLEHEDVFLRDEPDPETTLRDREAHDELHRTLATLQPRQRLAVVLRYYEGMSAREIADVLECSEGTARNTLFRGMQRLRATLTPESRTYEDRP